MSNTDTIGAIYSAFGTGDFESILSHLADEIDWESWADNRGQQAGLPWLQLRRGKDEVLEFFNFTTTMGLNRFDVISMMEGTDQVAAEVVIGCKYFTDEEVHLWNFNDEGKVTRMRHYVDTAKHIAGYEGSLSGSMSG